MKKVGILVLALALVVGMSFGVIADNFADIEQSSNDKDNSASAEAYLEQIGSGNETFLDQKTGSNTSGWPTFADITQDGDGNHADIIQSHSTSSTVHYLYLDQIGDDNEAILKQTGRSSGDIDIDQLGDRNLIRLEQSLDYSEDSNFNMVQDGNDNMVVGVGKNQYGMWLKDWDNASQAGSDFVGSQIGDDNKIGLNQGNNSSAVVDQIGNDNKVLLWQGDGGHIANVEQDGNNNISEVVQTSN